MLLTKPLKILILASYFNRPLLVRNALMSVLRANDKHKWWHLAFGDDGSEIPGEPIVRDILRDHLDKVSFYNTGMGIKEKLEKGITIGKMANEALAYTDCQVWITLCDDDELHPDYLKNLSDFFLKNKKVRWCWSKIHVYNPLTQSSDAGSLDNSYNCHDGAVEPYKKLDG